MRFFSFVSAKIKPQINKHSPKVCCSVKRNEINASSAKTDFASSLRKTANTNAIFQFVSTERKFAFKLRPDFACLCFCKLRKKISKFVRKPKQQKSRLAFARRVRIANQSLLGFVWRRLALVRSQLSSRDSESKLAARKSRANRTRKSRDFNSAANQ